MTLTLKRVASNASLDQESPRKKPLSKALSKVNLKSSRSIFGLHSRSTDDSFSSLDGIDNSPPRKKSFLGSIRSRASTALRTKRLSYHHGRGSTHGNNQTLSTTGSIRSRIVPRWEFSFLSRSQPISIPAGRTESLAPPESTPPTLAESHLQLRLRDDVDFSSSVAFSQPPFEAGESKLSNVRPPACSFDFTAPLRSPPDVPRAPKDRIPPSIGLWQPRTGKRFSDSTASSTIADVDMDYTDDDVLIAKMASLWENPLSNRFDKPNLLSINQVVHSDSNSTKTSNADKVKDQVMLNSTSNSHERHDSGYSDTPKISTSYQQDSFAEEERQSRPEKRRNSHVRFALDGQDKIELCEGSDEGSPTRLAIDISMPRTRALALSERPPTPADDNIELENRGPAGGTDTFKELIPFGSVGTMQYSSASKLMHGLGPSELQEVEAYELPAESMARKSLDRLTSGRKKQRSSAGSDSVETEFQPVHDGGVKSVKSIVMDGLRGPKSIKHGSRWLFAQSASPGASLERLE